MNNIASASRFSLLILKAGLRDIKAFAVSLGFPLFMLFAFWITTRDGSEESVELFEHIVPAIMAMAVMLPGQTQATRLVGWRERGTLRRLALAPLPVPAAIAGISLSQTIIAIFQGIVICLCCLIVSTTPLDIAGLLMIVVYLPLISLTFIALGFLLSAFFKSSIITGYAYFAVFLPLFFLGSFPSEELPAQIGLIVPWFPTSMGINLIDIIFANSGPRAGSLFSVIGLLTYAIVFISAGIFLYKNKIRKGVLI